MSTLQNLTAFLGWCTLINIGLLLFAALVLTLAREPVMALHSRLLGVSRDELSRAYLLFMSNYKIAVMVFNISPYLALKLMA